MSIFSNWSPGTVAEGEALLEDLCEEAETVMFPIGRNERQGLSFKRKNINTKFDKFLAMCKRFQLKDAAWAALGTQAEEMKERITKAKEDLQDSTVSIF